MGRCRRWFAAEVGLVFIAQLVGHLFDCFAGQIQFVLRFDDDAFGNEFGQRFIEIAFGDLC